MKRRLAWVQGAIVPAEAAAVVPDDRGLTHGEGCFETVAVHRGVPFALRRHLARLRRSCATLGLQAPDDDLLGRAATDLLAAEAAEATEATEAAATTGATGTGRLRITVTAGPPEEPGATSGPTPLVVLLTGPPRPGLDEPANVALGPWVRNERSPTAGVKATSYLENVLTARWAAERACDEALLANTVGQLCEGTASNVFVVVDGVLRTPPLTSGCLPGVTRELVCELARARGEVHLDDVPIPIDALDEVEEAFLTSSMRGVHPIGLLDGRSLAAPGPVTAALQGAWADLVRRTSDP